MTKTLQTIQEIQEPITAELALFEKNFKEQIRSKIFLLNTITNYIVKRKGKQIRPMFVFLSAMACGGITAASHRGAGLIELLHTATLVHDDVVDDSNYRRGFFSINALWKNKIAVLVGDYLLSRGLLLSVDNGDFNLLKLVSEAVKEMSEGELLQIEKARRLDITEDVYYDIIRQKTATLIASCCAVGAASAGSSPETIQRLKEFGSLTGMAFQIKDDLFDYGSDDVGKPLGIDIKEKKMTLPLIFALNQSSWWEKRTIINIVRNQSDKPDKVREVIQFVKEKGGLEYATNVMNDFAKKAIDLLSELPASLARNHLQGLVEFTINRKN
ncbi:MAG TPA: polyprenyl synthetase family protein [Catalimonadaceae bacterium]|nr:polyprenyl synthetase family protein [Catalimonadaceae bacterium]HPI10281.1 polyprenyl synthetase family protein [Catalimonadaceae bacterium]